MFYKEMVIHSKLRELNWLNYEEIKSFHDCQNIEEEGAVKNETINGDEVIKIYVRD